jgi:oligoendopeptidase F
MAQLGACQIWANSLSDPKSAVADYRKALALGGTRPLPVLYQAAGARLAFDAEALKQSIDLIESTLADLSAISYGE